MFARRFALAVAVLAGLIGSQGPEFAQQYRQRLGGALEELNRIIAEFDAEAQRQDLTPAEGLSRLEDNSDPLTRERGEDMAKATDRAKRLSAQLQAIESGNPLTRLYVMARNFDPEIAKSALDDYEPAAPLTLGALAARRPRRVLGLGGDAPHRVAVPPPLPPAGDAGAVQPGQSRLTPAVARLSPAPRAQANLITLGLAAIVAAVSPARVRLSPCESAILRPVAFSVDLARTAARSCAWVIPAVR
jgi:Protein of unknown function (DUF2937)